MLIWPTLSYAIIRRSSNIREAAACRLDTRNARPRNRSGDSRQRMPEADRDRYRNQHVGAGRSRACASRRRPDQALTITGAALSARGQGAGRAKPWQPCRRSRNLVNAGDRATSGRRGPRRSEPYPEQTTPGALTLSDPNSPNYSRSGSYGDPTRATAAKGEAARRHARRSQRTDRLVHRGRRRHAQACASPGALR